MMTLRKYIIYAAMAALLVPFAANAQDGFVKGLDNSVTYVPSASSASGNVLEFSTAGTVFKASAYYYKKSVTAVVENSVTGKRDILFMDGKLNIAGRENISFPKIGFSEGSELKSNEYIIGTHDFTDDGNPELVIAVRDRSSKGIAVYIMRYASSVWEPIGEMVSQGKGIENCRIFRQAVTFKQEGSGTLYTWTWHDTRFDFLASDKSPDPTGLF